MIALPVEGLVEGCEALLAIENQEGVVFTGDRGPLESSSRKDSLPVTHPQDAARGVVVGNRDDQGLGGTGLPDEVALKVGQDHVTCFDEAEQVEEALGVGVFVDSH